MENQVTEESVVEQVVSEVVEVLQETAVEDKSNTVEDKDAVIKELNEFIDQAVKLFSNMRKGYPVTTQVKQWLDSVNKRK